MDPAVKPRDDRHPDLLSTYDFIHVEIHSLPIEGRANEELIKYFSKLFKVAQYLIEFVRGETSKIKILRMKVSEYALIFIDSNNATIKIQDRIKAQKEKYRLW